MSLGAGRATSTREYQLLDTGTFTSTGAQIYTIPAGTFYLEIELWAGGGGGSKGYEASGRGSTTYYRGGGGGGGSYIKHIYYGDADMQKNDNLNFTVGAGGAEATAINDSGDNGEDTTLDSHSRGLSIFNTFTVDAGGGGGGRRPSGFGGSHPNSEAGTATNEGNTTNTDGVAGEVMATGGQLINGGDGGAGGNGGAGGGGSKSAGYPAIAGTVPGGGGGGGRPSDTSGADGANGKVIVKAYG